MPREFVDCVKRGGRVRTIKPSKGTHMPVCFDDDGSHAGEVKENKRMALGGLVKRSGSGRFRRHFPDGVEDE